MMRTLLVLYINLGLFTIMTMGQAITPAIDDGPPILNLDPTSSSTTLYRHRWYNFRPRSIFTEDSVPEEDPKVTEVKEEEVNSYREYHENFQLARSISEDPPLAGTFDHETPTAYTLYRHGPNGFEPVRTSPSIIMNPQKDFEEPIFVPVRPDEKDFDQPIQPGIGDRARLDWDRPDQRKYYYGTPLAKSTLPPPTLPPVVPSPTPWGGKPKDLRSWLNFKKHYNQLRAGLGKFLSGDDGNGHSSRPKVDPPRKPITLDDLGAHAGFIIVRSRPNFKQNPHVPPPNKRPVNDAIPQYPDYNNNAGPGPVSSDSDHVVPTDRDESPGPVNNVPPSQPDFNVYPPSQQSEPEDDRVDPPAPPLIVEPPAVVNKNFVKKSTAPVYRPDFRHRQNIPKPRTKTQNNGVNIVSRGGGGREGSRTNFPPDGAVLTIVVRKKNRDEKVAAASGGGGGGSGGSIGRDSPPSTIRRLVVDDDDDDEDENDERSGQNKMPWGVLGQHLAEEHILTTKPISVVMVVAGNSTKAPEFSGGIADALTFESKKLNNTQQQQSDYDVYRHFYE